MFDKIVYISDHGAHVKVNGEIKTNLINQHLVFVDELEVNFKVVLLVNLV